MMEKKIIGIAGWKNSGKTTLTTRLIGEFAARGLRVASVKHAHHTFEIDQPGRDSMRHREAGSSEVAIVSGTRWALIHELEGAPEPTLDEVLDKLAPADIYVVEGYKRAAIPKIETRRRDAHRHDPLAADDPNVIAIATDDPGESAGVPVFGLDDVGTIADFILTELAARLKNDGNAASGHIAAETA